MDAPPKWRLYLESLMLEALPQDAEHLAQLWRESRAAWLILLPAPSASRRLLLIGDARSGTAAGAARLGWHVTVLDPNEEHGTFAKERDQATQTTPHLKALQHIESSSQNKNTNIEVSSGAESTSSQEPQDPNTGRSSVAESPSAAAPVAGPLCQASQRFDCVLVEDPSALSIEDAAQLSQDLVAQTTDNSLAYKRSSGARADFRTTRPLAFLRCLLFERKGHLAAQRRRLNAATHKRARAAALYPDRRDFALVIDLDQDGPGLLIGPMERKNHLKILGHKLGLFPHLTPSFALWSSKQNSAAPRLVDDVLRALEVLLKIAPGTHTPEHLVATRGNTALVTTAAGWVLRIPLGHCAKAAVKSNAKNLKSIPTAAPTATLLFAGVLELNAGGTPLALFVTIETRFPGLGAGQLASNQRATARLLAQLGATLAKLESRAPAPMTATDFTELFSGRFQAVRERCAHPDTAAALDSLEANLKDLTTGLTIGRVATHRDLRPKHVIATPTGPNAGQLLGLVDWACFDPEGPPLYDLFHFIAQERASRPGSSSRTAWLTLQDRKNLEPHERTAIETYESELHLPPEWYEVIARAYPILFGAMAEEHWDYSRPRWLRRLFGIGVTDPE